MHGRHLPSGDLATICDLHFNFHPELGRRNAAGDGQAGAGGAVARRRLAESSDAECQSSDRNRVRCGGACTVLSLDCWMSWFQPVWSLLDYMTGASSRSAFVANSSSARCRAAS